MKITIHFAKKKIEILTVQQFIIFLFIFFVCGITNKLFSEHQRNK